MVTTIMPVTFLAQEIHHRASLPTAAFSISARLCQRDSLITPQVTGTEESEALREGSLALQEGGRVAKDCLRSVGHIGFSEQESLERQLAAAEIRCRSWKNSRRIPALLAPN
jgi:hypothetical protein